ncbi:acyl-CoA dehydrogenase family protein [Phenylobacterium sp.]|uniref:acyl-CoA dehydrogenase family protein n=1 Tax=Phenylobacterium sp. TaxID=1871053 RepID=UPI0035AEA8E4
MTQVETLSRPAEWAARAEALRGEIAAGAARCDAEDLFAADAFALLKAAGLFKAHVPEDLGGGGASYASLCEVVRILASGCGSTGLAFAMHSHIVALAVWRRTHEGAPTEGLLKRVAAEDLVLVSSGGSDWLQSVGRAEKVDGGFRITARKAFSSGCPAGDLLNTSAVYDDPEAGPTVLHFAVSLKADGVRILDTWRTLGMRATGSHDVELSEVFVPDAAIAGRRPQGMWNPLFHAISLIAFPIIYSAYRGVAGGARAIALEAVRKRAPDEGLVQLVGEMETAFIGCETAVDAMVQLAASSWPGPETTGRVMALRQIAGQAAIRTAERAMEAVGGRAFYRELGLERAFRDVQGARFHPLQEKPQLRYAGRLALGLDLDG